MNLKAALFVSLLAASGTVSVPVNFGVVVIPGFQALDVFGPLDALNMLSILRPMNLYIIANSTAPVSSRWPRPGSSINSNFTQSIVPTHTFDAPPPSLDVLLVPGGYGTSATDLNRTIAYIKATYPTVDYLITISTGSWLAARAGVLSNKRATSNKLSWSSRPLDSSLGVKWIAHARWVVDGNVWSSSGVSAGIDTTMAWIEQVYGAAVAQNIADAIEYFRTTDASYDPFAEMYGYPPDE